MVLNYLYTLNERCGEFMLVCGEDTMTEQTNLICNSTQLILLSLKPTFPYRSRATSPVHGLSNRCWSESQ